MTAPKIFDRVKDSTVTTGTGTITLANSAPSSYQTYAAAGVSNGDYVKYCVVAQSGGLVEGGYGVYNSSGGVGGNPTITRVAAQVEFGSSGAGVLVSFTAGTSDVLCVDSAASHGGNAIYGDFSNGALTFDGTSVVAGVTPSSNIYVLTQHIYGTVIIVNSGVTIKTAGFGIWGLLKINNGTIHADGVDASGGTLGAAQWLVNGSPFAGGTAGLVGKTSLAAGGQPAALINTYGGAGGAGGASGQGQAGGGSGGVNVPNAANGAARHYPAIIAGSFVTRPSSQVIQLNCGNGGASGGFSTGTSSGAGGGGGGQMAIVVKHIINNGAIHSNGGLGGSATGVGNAGAGGGGGGGTIVCIYNTFTGNNPVCSGGGAGVAGIGTGSAGSSGSSGTVFLISNS